MNYDPPKGSLAYRLVEYLRRQPAGAKVASGPLSAAMGQPSSAVITAMMKPVAHGLVIKERIDGLYYWSLGNGVPTLPAEPDPLPVKQAVIPAPEPEPEPAPTVEPAPEPEQPKEQTVNTTFKASPATEPLTPEIKRDTAKPSFRFCVWNDWSMDVIKDGTQIHLTAQEVAHIDAFLNPKQT